MPERCSVRWHDCSALRQLQVRLSPVCLLRPLFMLATPATSPHNLPTPAAAADPSNNPDFQPVTMRRYHWSEWTKRVHPPAPVSMEERFAPSLRPGGKPTRIDLHYKVGGLAGVPAPLLLMLACADRTT